eukprot:TRINITY_DN851_c0_g1_i34.p1 TRINITY_DN851_c0_g1~~TRINITY_DN851_c0_g1_i34.p1  ORF type:complete len:165 (+),score=27.66 TRINITY_DN851_c0_g1_i34:1224-1718(+)
MKASSRQSDFAPAQLSRSLLKTHRLCCLARTKTSLTTSWTISEWWSVGSTYASPNLAASLQEVVDGASWMSGNTISLIEKGAWSATGARRTAESRNGDGVGPVLKVTYSVATSPPVPPTPPIPQPVPPSPGPVTGIKTIYVSTSGSDSGRYYRPPLLLWLTPSQ